jgi:hypothetical protein
MPCIRRDMESAGVYMRQIVHSHARLLCSAYHDECPAVQET